MANAHWRVNQIGRLRVNEVELSSSKEIRGAIVDFYEHLFRADKGAWRRRLDGVYFDAIS